jgi:putative membrane protein
VKHSTIARSVAAFVAVAGITAAALAVSAQTAPPYAPPGAMPGPRMPASDADFVRALDRANTSELDMAKYVVNMTKDPAVHQFAQHMIDDHSTAAVKLEAATRGTNMLGPVPRDDGALRGPGMRGLAVLQAESGPQMDTDFMRMQVPAHQRVLALLQWESQNGTNAGLKALATTLTPTVQQHLQLAQSYLAAHNLTPYTPTVVPVPGNVNPGNRGAGPGPGTPNNPASGPGNGGTAGQNNGAATPAPSTSPSPRPM